MGRWLFKTAFHGIVAIALLSLIVATWFTWSQARGAAAAPGQEASSPTAAAQPASAQAGVSVNAAVLGVRLIVVDQDEVVREVWSNTAGPDYVLTVRLGDRWGPDYPATERVFAQYRRIEPTLAKGVTYVQ